MRISDITCTPLAIGKGLLRIATGAGVEGWAEVPGRNNAVFEAYLDSVIRPALVGEDPRLVDRHWETLALGRAERSNKLPGWVVGVIDVALWDLLGKDTGLPVHTLMGGARRTTIPLYWSTGLGWRLQPDEMLAQVRDGREQGFRAFKIRMDWRGWRQDVDPEKDFQMFKLVREFLDGGEYLGFDANNGYSVATAIQQGRRFEELGIDHFEEPIPHYDLPGLRQVADALDVAVSAGEQDAFRWWFEHLVLLRSCRTARRPASTRWPRCTCTPPCKTPPARTSSPPSSRARSTTWPTCTARRCCRKMAPLSSATGRASASSSTKPRWHA